MDVEAFLRELGQRIADLRKDAGLTQTQLADKVGVSQQIIASYENGKRNFPVGRLLEVAEALNISASELLTGTKKDRSKKKTRLDEQLAAVKQLPARKRQFVSEFLDTVVG
jgi:transcriptional regulator with XRE-family HTH domain